MNTVCISSSSSSSVQAMAADPWNGMSAGRIVLGVWSAVGVECIEGGLFEDREPANQ